MKPSDIFIGVIELFAVLMPGAAAVWLLVTFGHAATWLKLEGLSETRADAAFVFGAWFCGQLLFRLGALLDGPYDRRRRRLQPTDRDEAFQVAQRIRRDRTERLPMAVTTVKWAKAWLAHRSSAALADVERHEASSKFFRSMTVLLGIVAVVAIGAGLTPGLSADPAQRVLEGAVAAALSWACFLAFYDYRLKSTERAYLEVILLDSLPAAPGAGESGEGREAGGSSSRSGSAAEEG